MGLFSPRSAPETAPPPDAPLAGAPARLVDALGGPLGDVAHDPAALERATKYLDGAVTRARGLRDPALLAEALRVSAECEADPLARQSFEGEAAKCMAAIEEAQAAAGALAP